MNEAFRRFSQRTSEMVGSSWAFLVAATAIVVWGITGPLFGFSDTWQLVINTGTTIVTFLMVFLIQNTQNRDAKALHLKLDELIRATDAADDYMINLEELGDEEIVRIQEAFQHLQQMQHRRLSDCAVLLQSELARRRASAVPKAA